MSHLPVGPVHHLRLAVSDVRRSVAFYTEILGFQVAVDAPPPPDDENYEALVDSLQGGVILMHQGMFVGLRPVDEERANAADRFDPFRVGLDHLSFSVPSRADLDAATRSSMTAASNMGQSESWRHSACPSWRSSIPTASPSNSPHRSLIPAEHHRTLTTPAPNPIRHRRVDVHLPHTWIASCVAHPRGSGLGDMTSSISASPN